MSLEADYRNRNPPDDGSSGTVVMETQMVESHPPSGNVVLGESNMVVS